MKNEIINLFKKINHAYKKRDINYITDNYEDLFSNQCVLIGTSLNELCISKDEIIKLFSSDFEGWGDFTIDLDSIKYEEVLGNIVVTSKANLKVSFDSSNQKYDNYLSEIEYIDSKNSQKEKSATEIIWLMTHLMRTFKEEKRQYLWTLEFTTIINKYDDKLLMDLVMFSYPFENDNYDIVLNDEPYFKDVYKKEINRLDTLNNQLISDINIKLNLNIKELWSLNNLGKNKNFFIGSGYLIECFDFDKYYQNVLNYYKNSKDDSQRTMFNVTRDLAYAMHANSLGDREIMFRIIGINDKFIIKYPYQMILENKSNKEIKL